MKTFFKILKWLGLFLILLVGGLITVSLMQYDKTFDAPYPDIHASNDSTIIARGKHLVFSTAHCIECHYKPGDSLAVANGEEVAIAGGYRFNFPGGSFYSKNISSDKEYGIGSLRDEEIARSLRYGVKHDGTVLIPAMEFQNISDEDLTAIISYLRTVPPVHHEVPDNSFNLLGKAILSFLIKPAGPTGTPPAKVVADTTVEYGKYIVQNVSSCRGCHTERDANTAAYIGQELAGGPLELVGSEPKRMLYAANLTPDKTGVLFDWTFEKFKNRFSQGRIIKESIMPWPQFRKMNDTELVAIWKYLKTVEPVHNDIGSYLHIVK